VSVGGPEKGGAVSPHAQRSLVVDSAYVAHFVGTPASRRGAASTEPLSTWAGAGAASEGALHA
jgi:hypothetical protein